MNKSRGKLIFTSRGLNTGVGTELIGAELQKENLEGKKIFLVSVPEYEVDELLVQNCKLIGFKEENIVCSGELTDRKQAFDWVYVTEGNTFLIAKYMRENDLFRFVQDCVNGGAGYIGSSAGAILAGDDFELATDFDRNYSEINDYTGLQLFEGTIIPHYEPEELERYIANTEAYRIQRYKNIYSVGNEEVVVME